MSDDPIERFLQAMRSDNRIKVVLIGTALLLFWLLWAGGSGPASRFGGTDGTIAQAATWGDSFGGFNALVSTFGFLALYYTIQLQILSGNEQKRDVHLQRFESSFFELCRLMRELRSELKYTPIQKQQVGTSTLRSLGKTKYGSDAITAALKDIRSELVTLVQSDGRVEKKIVSQTYLRLVHIRFESRFAPYFRIIYTILHKIMIDEILSETEKAYYGNLVRSQLTSHEISLLAINGTAKVAKDLDIHIIYFRMLKYLPMRKMRQILSHIYPPEAFEERD